MPVLPAAFGMHGKKSAAAAVERAQLFLFVGLIASAASVLGPAEDMAESNGRPARVSCGIHPLWMQ